MKMKVDKNEAWDCPLVIMTSHLSINTIKTFDSFKCTS